MIKTESDIERDFYDMVDDSALRQAISGAVYRSEMRPANAKTEDVIVKFLAGLDNQVQSGVVVLNIYVPDIAYGSSGRKVANYARIATLQSLARDFVQSAGGTEYWLSPNATPTSSAVEGIEQHVISVRINFQRITI